MSPSQSASNERYSDTDTTLKILHAVEHDGSKTQRALAGDAEIALGLANAYLKRCIRKGWIKVRQAPARRYLYYITPKGFAEKARLTAEYLSASFDMFRAARGDCDALIERCQKRGCRRLALIGTSDLAEIAVLSSLGTDVEVVAVVDPSSNQAHLAGVPIMRELAEIGDIDAVLLTDIRAPQRTYEQLRKSFAEERIFVPTILRVIRNRPSGETIGEEAAE